MWQPNREYVSTEYFSTQRAEHSSLRSLSTPVPAGPGIRLFHTVELCRNALAGYPSSAMHIYSVWLMLSQSVCVVEKVPVLIFSSLR